jgi:hypothetical protein
MIAQFTLGSVTLDAEQVILFRISSHLTDLRSICTSAYARYLTHQAQRLYHVFGTLWEFDPMSM